MSLLRLPRKAVSGLARVLFIKAALAAVRRAAEGDYGPAVQHAYWATAGVKTWSGFALAVVAASLAAGGYTEAAAAFGGVAVFLIETGLLDKAWRSHLPPALRTSKTYLFLAAHTEYVAAACGYVAVHLYETCGGATAWASTPCQAGAVSFGVVTVALIHVGLLDAAWRSPRPIPWPSFERGRRG